MEVAAKALKKLQFLFQVSENIFHTKRLICPKFSPLVVKISSIDLKKFPKIFKQKKSKVKMHFHWKFAQNHELLIGFAIGSQKA